MYYQRLATRAWAANYRAVELHNSGLSIVTAPPTVKTLILCQNCFIELNYPGKFQSNAIALYQKYLNLRLRAMSKRRRGILLLYSYSYVLCS